MKPRVLLPKPEADQYVRQAAEDFDGGNLRLIEDMGLHTWWPHDCATSIEDTDRPYFFWVYHYEEVTKVGRIIDRSPYYFIAGTDSKKGQCIFDSLDTDVVVEGFTEREDLMENMKPTKGKDLRAMGISELEAFAYLTL